MQFWNKIKNICKKTSPTILNEVQEQPILSEQNEDLSEGVYVIFELQNNGEQNVLVDAINPNQTAIKSLGIFLFLSSIGKLTPEILKEIGELILEKPELAESCYKAIKYSEELDKQFDLPTMKPSDVFQFRH